MKGRLRGGKEQQHWSRPYQFCEKLVCPYARPPLPFLLQCKCIFPVTLICCCSPELPSSFQSLVRHCHVKKETAPRTSATLQLLRAEAWCSGCLCSTQHSGQESVTRQNRCYHQGKRALAKEGQTVSCTEMGPPGVTGKAGGPVAQTSKPDEREEGHGDFTLGAQ